MDCHCLRNGRVYFVVEAGGTDELELKSVYRGVSGSQWSGDYTAWSTGEGCREIDSSRSAPSSGNGDSGGSVLEQMESVLSVGVNAPVTVRSIILEDDCLWIVD